MTYRDNFPEVSAQLVRFQKKSAQGMGEIIRQALGIISIISVRDHFRTAGTGGTGEGRFGVKTVPDKLTMRTRELASSVLGTQIPASHRYESQRINPSGRQHHIEKIQVLGDKIKGMIGSSLPYASVHEKGATIQAKSGGYLTFRLPGGQWIKTPSVDIGKRPYLQPARETAMAGPIPEFVDTEIQKLADRHI